MGNFKLANDMKNDITSISIYSILTIAIIFFESIIVLLNAIKNGIWKKEVLSSDSKLGFDIDIIIKS